jgi:hypothetical protein
MREMTGGCKPCGQESMLELSNRLPQGIGSHGPRPRSMAFAGDGKSLLTAAEV